MSHQRGRGSELYNKKKKRDLEQSLQRGMTQLVLDSRCEGVSLPLFLMGQLQVVLNLSYAFRLKTLEINSAGVRASLSFSKKEHLCVIPWESVYFIRLASGEEPGEMYLQSMPTELRRKLFAASHLSEEELEALYGGEPAEEGLEAVEELEASESFDEEGFEEESFDEDLFDEDLFEDDLPPLVRPAPPRPALRRADLDEPEDELDTEWVSRLPQIERSHEPSPFKKVSDEALHELQEEDGALSFKAFMAKKEAQEAQKKEP